MSGRSAALANFLGLESPVRPEEFPESFDVPAPIHDGAMEGLSGTHDDWHERSIHFSFRQNRWRGGLAVKGSRYHTNSLHQLSAVFFPPHIHVHTHPSVSWSELDTFVGLSTIDGVYGYGYDEALEEMSRSYLENVHRLPSSSDIYKTIHEPAGTVGHMLLSEYGIFAWLHRDLSSTKGVLQNPFSPAYRKKERFAREMQACIDGEDEESISQGLTIDEVVSRLVSSRVRALSPKYVSYANDDPENPRLTKIE